MKTVRTLAIILLLFIAINALVAGYLLMIDPSGSKLGLPLSLLRYSPFQDFFIPGIILFTANGLLNLNATLFALLKWKNYPAFIVWQGIILFLWIFIQVILLREFNFLHAALGSMGIVLFIFGNRLNV